jgi:hypothetical protein
MRVSVVGRYVQGPPKRRLRFFEFLRSHHKRSKMRVEEGDVGIQAAGRSRCLERPFRIEVSEDPSEVIMQSGVTWPVGVRLVLQASRLRSLPSAAISIKFI